MPSCADCRDILPEYDHMCAGNCLSLIHLVTLIMAPKLLFLIAAIGLHFIHLQAPSSMNISDIDLKLLRVFHAVVEAQGFHNAQEVLNVSASTVSTHMNQLETRVGFKLCERGRSGFSLTPKGELFHRHVLAFFNAMHTLQSKTQDLRKEQAGHLTLGIIDNLASDDGCPLHAAMVEFYKKHNQSSGPRLSIQVLSPEAIEKGLLENELDLGIGIFYRQHSNLTYEPLYRERDVLVCHSSHRLAGVTDPRELADAMTAEQKVVRHFMQQQEFPFIAHNDESVIASVCNVEEALLMILHGPFIGFLPWHYAERWIVKGELVPILPNTFVRHSQIFIARATATEQASELVQYFLDCLKKEPALQPAHQK